MYSIEDLMEFDRQQAAEFLVSAVKSGELQLKHPKKDVVTFCRQSVRYRKANIVLFSDQSLQNHWYMIQIYNLADGYIFDDVVSNPTNAGEIRELVELLKQSKLPFDNACKNTTLNGLLFSQVRPYHYMYDQMVSYFHLSEIEPIAGYAFRDKNCFYSELPGGVELKQVEEDGCYLFPCTLGGIYDDKYALQMHAFLKGNSVAKRFNSELTLWFGITAQKRSWLEQSEGQCKIVKQLLKYYKPITVIVDGWTSLAGGVPDSPKDIARDMAVFDSFSSQLRGLKGIELVSLIGKDYKEKIGYARGIDYFVANSGTGGMVPMMFTQSKGVIHTNGRLHTFERSYNDKVKIVPDSKIVAQDLSLDSGVYSIEWTVVYNLLLDLMGLEKKLPEKGVVKNKHYFTLKRFVFKKSIQAGMALRELRNKLSKK